MNQILVYGSIFNFTAASFVIQLENTPVTTGAHMRLSSPGGDPTAMWDMIEKWQEFTGKKFVSVGGQAQSAAFFFLLYADDNECIPQSIFMVHRARSFFEDNETIREQLKITNENLKKDFIKRIDVAKFEEISNVTVDRLFDTDKKQIDVTLNAQQAKDIGLIKKIKSLSPSELTALNEHLIAAQAAPVAEAPAEETEETEEIETENINTMTKEELKSKHPDTYQAIYAEGHKIGVAEEKDRNGAWMAYADVDLKAVKEGIESGKAPSMTAMAEMNRKALNAEQQAGLESQNAGATETEEAEKKETEKKETEKKEDKNLAKFEAELDKDLNLNAEK